MLRAVLVGLLSVSAVACKSGGDSPKSQPGIAAGKVVEVTGSVMVRHDDVAQPLVKGATVEGDDVIETGADGNVIIELTHNLARWELGANKSTKVKDSTAWGLAKKSGEAANVEQDTAAAGRNAERSAADTSVSANEEAKKEAAPASAEPAAAGAPAAATTPSLAQSPRAEAPPPPPAPPKLKRPSGESDELLDVPSGGGAAPKPGLTRGGGGTKTADGAASSSSTESAVAAKPMSPAEADKAAMDVVLKNEKTLKACLTKDAQAVSVSIKIAASGKATAVVTAKAPVPGAVQSCIKTAVGKMKFAAMATTVNVQVER